jgi:hypothetical protein
MRGLLLLASLSLLTLAAVPAAEPTPTAPISTWTPGPPQPKVSATALPPAATTVPSPLSTPGPAPAQSPIFIPVVGTPATHRDSPARSWLKAIGIVTLVVLVAGVLWRLKPFRRRQ